MTPLPSWKQDEFCRRVLSEVATFVADVHSTTRGEAGQKLGKTGAGVAKSYRRVERALARELNGGVLVKRGERGKERQLTDAGAALLRFAEEVLRRSEAFVDELQFLQQTNRVRVAIVQSAWQAYGKDVDDAFVARMPDGRVTWNSIDTPDYESEIVQAVQDGRADVGVLTFPTFTPARVPGPFTVERLPPQPMMYVEPAGGSNARSGRAAKVAPALEVADLSQLVRALGVDNSLRFILYEPHVGFPLTREVEAYLERLSLRIPVANLMRMRDVTYVRDSVEQGAGVSILPLLAIRRDLVAGRLRARRMPADMPPIQWGLVYRRTSSRPAVREFVACFRAQVADDQALRPYRAYETPTRRGRRRS